MSSSTFEQDLRLALDMSMADDDLESVMLSHALDWSAAESRAEAEEEYRVATSYRPAPVVRPAIDYRAEADSIVLKAGRWVVSAVLSLDNIYAAILDRAIPVPSPDPTVNASEIAHAIDTAVDAAIRAVLVHGKPVDEIVKRAIAHVIQSFAPVA